MGINQYTIDVKRRNIWQLLILYSCLLFYAVFLTPNRYDGGTSTHINIIPLLKTAKRFFERGDEHFWPYYIEYWGNIFGNILLFIPFGFLLKCLYPQQSSVRLCAYGCLLSICIELIQFSLQIGVCDIDDVILNVIGTAAGIYLCRFIRS